MGEASAKTREFAIRNADRSATLALVGTWEPGARFTGEQANSAGATPVGGRPAHAEWLFAVCSINISSDCSACGACSGGHPLFVGSLTVPVGHPDNRRLCERVHFEDPCGARAAEAEELRDQPGA